MKPVFLSASEPDPKRSEEYWNSRNLLNVREAVRALAPFLLNLSILICIIGVVGLGVYPKPLVMAALRAASNLF